MNKIIEILAIALGGLSLFAVCFLGFAVMSGQSMENVPVIGELLADEEQGDGDPNQASKPSKPSMDKSDTEIVESTVSVLQHWSMPSPFSASELNDLAEEMKARSARLDQWEQELDAAEAAVAEEKQTLSERRESLEALQQRLEEYERELSLRAQEVERSEDDAAQRLSRKWSVIASVIENGELEGQRAVEAMAEYEPEEAAQILRHLDAARASVILGAMQKHEGLKKPWTEYMEAYSVLPQASNP